MCSYISVFRPLIVSETVESAAQELSPRLKPVLMDVHVVEEAVTPLGFQALHEPSLREIDLTVRRTSRRDRGGGARQFSPNTLVLLSPNPAAVTKSDAATALPGVVIQAHSGRLEVVVPRMAWTSFEAQAALLQQKTAGAWAGSVEGADGGVAPPGSCYVWPVMNLVTHIREYVHSHPLGYLHPSQVSQLPPPNVYVPTQVRRTVLCEASCVATLPVHRRSVSSSASRV